MTETRVATHVHSEWSYDAHWPLAQLAHAFRRRGYRAVLLAEHDRGFDEDRWRAYRAACEKTSTAAIRLVPGIEYSDPANTVHIPVWGDIPFLGEALETRELLERVNGAGGLAVLAHPRRGNVLSRLEPEWLRHLVGIELWNRRYDGFAPNREVAELLLERPELLPFSSLDFHTARHFHPLAMVFDLQRGATEASITDALRERHVRPTAYRLPALSFARGAAWPAMRELERARKGALGRARRAKAAYYKRRR